MLKIKNKCLIIFLTLPFFVVSSIFAEDVVNKETNVSESVAPKIENNTESDSNTNNNKSREELVKELEVKISNNYSILDDLNLDKDSIFKLSVNPENYVVVYLENITLLIQLYPEVAPNAVARFKQLIRNGFYEKTNFFRFIPNYIIQAGDPSDSRYGGEGDALAIEDTSSVKFSRGTVALANNGKFNDSQFFIAYNSFPWLDNTSTIIGRVVSGMDSLDNINVGTYNNDGILDKSIPILKMVVLGDENNNN